MSLLHHPALFAAYPALPHRLLNHLAGVISRARHPRPIIDWVIREWIRRDAIDLADFATRDGFATIEDFFLRRLRPGARPIGRGVISPVDGQLVAVGTIDDQTSLRVKGQRLTLQRLVNGRHGDWPLGAFRGGDYASIFLSPRGYHRIHQPSAGAIVDVRHIPGRFFPQNEAALASLRGVYEKNERAVLRLCRDDGSPLFLVLVGASLVGGIHLAGLQRPAWVRPGPVAIGLHRRKGDEIGHFAFGSTVIVLTPPGLGQRLHREGDTVRMGEPLLAT